MNASDRAYVLAALRSRCDGPHASVDVQSVLKLAIGYIEAGESSHAIGHREGLERRASVAEISAEMDRRGAVIDTLQAQIASLTAARDAALDRAVKAEGRETDMISECEHWQQIVERKDRELATTRASGHREGLEAAAGIVEALQTKAAVEATWFHFRHEQLAIDARAKALADALAAIRASVPIPADTEEKT